MTKYTSIEELVNEIPGAVSYLMKKGITCIICGEPTWDNIEEAARGKGFSDKEIDLFVKDLNELQDP